MALPCPFLLTVRTSTHIGYEKDVFTEEQVFKKDGGGLTKAQRTVKVAFATCCAVSVGASTHVALCTLL